VGGRISRWSAACGAGESGAERGEVVDPAAQDLHHPGVICFRVPGSTSVASASTENTPAQLRVLRIDAAAKQGEDPQVE
jgi:hypothetical protein